MEILLRRDVEHLGKAGERVEVASGYARNYLFPRKLATPITAENLRRLDDETRQAEREAAKEHGRLVALAARLESTSCTIAVQATDTGTLFGSVAPAQIGEALRAETFKVDDKAIQLDDPIKETGIYAIKVQLAPDVVATTRIWVVAHKE